MTSSSQSLVPLTRRLPVRRQQFPLVAVERMFPAARRTLAAAAVGFAAEYMLRALANRALGSAVRTAVQPARPSRDTRTIVTEFVIIERRIRRL